jgi:type IV secretory pathway TraG/TraD family ATPase VirD4
VLRQVRPRTALEQLEWGFWTCGSYAAMAWAGYGLYVAVIGLIDQLIASGWGGYFQTTVAATLLEKCFFKLECQANFANVWALYDSTRYLGPGIVFAFAGLVAQAFKHTPIYKAASAGRMATRKELRRYFQGDRVGWLGLIPKHSWIPKLLSGQSLLGQWNQLELRIPNEERNENMFVYGPPGSGKTAGVFRTNLWEDAKRSSSAVVFDMKYPDRRQGLCAVVDEWRLLKRSVEVFAPLEQHSKSIDLFIGCEHFDVALEAASIFVPIPLVRSDGAFFEDQERMLLAALIVDGKLKHGVRLDEIYVRLKGGVAALATFVRNNPHLARELTTFLNMHEDRVSGVMNGLAGKLAPLLKGNLPIRLAGQGECINLERVFLEPTLLYIGVARSEITNGRGGIIMRLVKRVLDETSDKVARAHGGRVPVQTTLYLDELLNLGRLEKLDDGLLSRRSQGIAHVLGIHSHDKGRATYTRDTWKAIVKACRHRIYFLGAIDPEDQIELEEQLGSVTVFERSVTDDETGRRSTTKEATRPLVSREEMQRWPKFQAIVRSQEIPPFISWFYPLFDPRHPEHRVHRRISILGENLPAPEFSASVANKQPAIMHPNQVRLELARLACRAVEAQWGCAILRERGEVVAVRLTPNEAIEPVNLPAVNWDGTRLEIRECQRIGQEFLNVLVWLSRRGEVEVWLKMHAAQVFGLKHYRENPLAEIEAETLWMTLGPAAAVLGKGFVLRKPMEVRRIDGQEFEVVAVPLVHKGMDILKLRLKALEVEAQHAQGLVA